MMATILGGFFFGLSRPAATPPTAGSRSSASTSWSCSSVASTGARWKRWPTLGRYDPTGWLPSTSCPTRGAEKVRRCWAHAGTGVDLTVVIDHCRELYEPVMKIVNDGR